MSKLDDILFSIHPKHRNEKDGKCERFISAKEQIKDLILEIVNDSEDYQWDEESQDEEPYLSELTLRENLKKL